MPHTVLVVDDDASALSAILKLLVKAGYRALGTTSFEEASSLLSSTEPSLLIADIRLGAYNGLHLVLRGRMRNPRLQALIVSGFSDPLLELEAKRLGVSEYLLKPIDPTRFLAAVAEALSGEGRQRRWPRKRAPGDLVAQVAEQSARVVDLSYGGLRIELAHPPAGALPHSVVLTLPSVGLSLNGDAVWMRETGVADAVMCGVALSAPSAPTVRAWHRLVDELPG